MVLSAEGKTYQPGQQTAKTTITKSDRAMKAMNADANAYLHLATSTNAQLNRQL